MDGPRLEVVLVDLASALFAHVLDAEPALRPDAHRRTLVLRIRSFVQHHLGDPRLTPGSIAAAHHISTSYLHRLFQEDDDLTVSAWIRQQRLERPRRDLADPVFGTEPVSRIAARWGFTHAATFSRALRDAYGLPPRDYRDVADTGRAG
ncbi:helix-turn-helix transcriptional regulator [Plantactinospora sp. B24E8]|uniref:helix-turn-helix transcriptional regulator n=1 Tax=Plantactinospora sp. B24E8 TaxID=3153567 RepID=UPI00325D9229